MAPVPHADLRVHEARVNVEVEDDIDLSGYAELDVEALIACAELRVRPHGKVRSR